MMGSRTVVEIGVALLVMSVRMVEMPAAGQG